MMMVRASMMVLLLLTIFEKVFRKATEYPSSNSTQETVARLLAQHVSCDATTEGA